MYKRGALGIAIALMLIIGILLFGGCGDEPELVTSHITSDLELSGTLSVAGASTLTGATTLTGAATTGAGLTTGTTLDVGTFLGLTAATSITVTDNLEIIPTGSYQPLAAAGNVGTDSITTTGFTNGDLVLFYNTSNTTITITDTGTIMLSGDAAIAQYDNLLLLFDGTNWIEISRADN